MYVHIPQNSVDYADFEVSIPGGVFVLPRNVFVCTSGTRISGAAVAMAAAAAVARDRNITTYAAGHKEIDYTIYPPINRRHYISPVIINGAAMSLSRSVPTRPTMLVYIANHALSEVVRVFVAAAAARASAGRRFRRALQ